MVKRGSITVFLALTLGLILSLLSSGLESARMAGILYEACDEAK